MARSYRFVPDSFAEFLFARVRKLSDAELLASGPYGCVGCGQRAALGSLDGTGDALCEGCLRYHHGYEQAEEWNVRLIVASAVAAALASGAPVELVRVAVEDALCEHVRVEADLYE